MVSSVSGRCRTRLAGTSGSGATTGRLVRSWLLTWMRYELCWRHETTWRNECLKKVSLTHPDGPKPVTARRPRLRQVQRDRGGQRSIRPLNACGSQSLLESELSTPREVADSRCLGTH